MTQTTVTPPYTLDEDEKMVVVVVYTPGILFAGDLIVKKIIRVSTWLRTNTAPDRICLYNTKAMVTSQGPAGKPMLFKEIHIATRQIEAFHMLPPAKDPPDYDPTEPNRRMQPVTALLGSFRINGNLRLSAQSTLAKYLDIAREDYVPIYDAQVSNLLIPSIGVMNVPYLIVRQERCVFTIP